MTRRFGTHAVKVRLKDTKQFQFLTSDGGLNRLRIHAALSTPERCAEYAANILKDNPDVVEATKVVEILKGR